ncbi:MAG TPA: glycosyltransferase 87 family protein [Gaiellaceae bacterium]
MVQAVAVGIVLFTVSWGLLHVSFWQRSQIVDTPVYKNYGDAVMDGEVPYRDFGLEYPPAALPVFVLPALARGADYSGAFELLMWACGIAAIVSLGLALGFVDAGPARLYAAVGFFALAPLALGPVILSRFDLWPAALTIAALAAFLGRRERVGFGVLGLAAAAKIYPLVLLPVALAWTAKQRGTRELGIGLAVFAGVVAACFLPFLVLAPGGVAHSIGEQVGRPLQIESLAASLLLAAEQLGLYEATVTNSHGSQNLAGQLPDALATIVTAFQVVAVAAVWALYAARDRGRERLIIAFAAAVAAFVAFGKVLSPQFLIWLLPLVPAVAGAGGLAAGGVLAVALVTTQLWFPTRYWDVVALEPVTWLVFVRDALLVALFAILIAALSRRGRAGFHSV